MSDLPNKNFKTAMTIMYKKLNHVLRMTENVTAMIDQTYINTKIKLLKKNKILKLKKYSNWNENFTGGAQQ